MARANSCYTYFAIKGNFAPDEVTRLLDLSPTKQWCVGDLRSNGTAYDFALWEYGRCDDYDVITENQMMCTIENLMPKVGLLREIKEKYDVTFWLEIVPTVYPGEPSPCLAPNRDIIDFCYQTETEIDIDLYVYDKSGEET